MKDDELIDKPTTMDDLADWCVGLTFSTAASLVVAFVLGVKYYAACSELESIKAQIEAVRQGGVVCSFDDVDPHYHLFTSSSNRVHR